MTTETSPAASNRGWIVTFAGTGINLALGVLYAWSIFKVKIGEEFGWGGPRLNDPYALCCLVFAFTMIFAGRCQDFLGPRFTATIGGLLVGIGFYIASLGQNYWMWMLGFGLLFGIGLGFGYSSATPPALKWFPPAKTGLIAGLVVAGFGLAPVYLAPLTKHLVASSVLHAMHVYSIAFAIAVVVLAQFLKNPPPVDAAAPVVASTVSTPAPSASSMAWKEILRTPRFYFLWICYFIGSGAGLMVISSLSSMATKSMGNYAFIAVAVLAIGNAGGRIGAGLLSDRIGRRWTLMLVLLLQAVLMFLAIPIVGAKDTGGFFIVLLAACIGANYGANLSLFPSFTKDLWGLKNFGVNYGMVFTAWGVGGFVLSRLQQTLTSSSGSYKSSFITAGTLLVVGALLTLALRPPRPKYTVAT